MAYVSFDPNGNKVNNAYGGFDANEKGLAQYPRPTKELQLRKVGLSSQLLCCGEQPCCYPVPAEQVFSNHILDPVNRHYRRFIQDPGLHMPDSKHSKENAGDAGVERRRMLESEVKTCGIRKLSSSGLVASSMKRPIDPIHWKPDLFDTQYEKYYLRNLMNEDPYRQFLTDCVNAAEPQQLCSEYRQSFSGNPVLPPTRVYGLGRPTDLPETCDWRRNTTTKLRDVMFTKDKDPFALNLDYNDPKRYNPWPRLRMSYKQMVEGNYRPRPLSGVQYSVTTLLPAISTRSKLWVV